MRKKKTKNKRYSQKLVKFKKKSNVIASSRKNIFRIKNRKFDDSNISKHI